MSELFDPFQEKMRAEGLPDLAVRTFQHYFEQLAAGAEGTLSRAEIEPVESLPEAAGLGDRRGAGERALAQTVVIKLNGGLGTSMGMTRAKSLLPVKQGLTFLDVIARQIQQLGQRVGQPVPLVLMNSFRTRDDSLALLERYGDLAAGLPRDFLQHKVPRILAADLSPVEWPAEPSHEWCPPGHGDLYPALVTSGMLEAMLDAGRRYAFVSNSDNLGAVLDLDILGWFAEGGFPFAMEAKRREEGDRKGGHLARLRDGRLTLREIAQCPPDERESFEDTELYGFFNTNNLWIDLEALQSAMREQDGVLPLPMIRNDKTVDPTDPGSPAVIQLETAMGAALSVFPGARAILVPSHRFAPVKTTADLLAVRSDAFVLSEDHRVVPAPGRAAAPYVDLDPAFYKTIAAFDERFPHGAPSLVACRRLEVQGDVHFGRDVVIEGDVHLRADDAPRHIPDGQHLGDVS